MPHLVDVLHRTPTLETASDTETVGAANPARYIQQNGEF